MDRKWKLGDDLYEKDSLLDGFTFEQLIIALHSGSRQIDRAEVLSVVKEIVEQNMTDLNFLVENNMDEIIERAMEGRC